MAKLKSYTISMQFQATDIVDAEMFIINNTIENWLDHLKEEE